MPVDHEKLRRLTLELRQALDRVDNAVVEAQVLLDSLEEAAGLVTETGARIDEG